MSDSITARCFFIACLRMCQHVNTSSPLKLSDGNYTGKADGYSIPYLATKNYSKRKDERMADPLLTLEEKSPFPWKTPASQTTRSKISKQLETVCSSLVWVFSGTAGGWNWLHNAETEREEWQCEASLITSTLHIKNQRQKTFTFIIWEPFAEGNCSLSLSLTATGKLCCVCAQGRSWM